MLKQEPAVHEVVLARAGPLADVSRLEGNVRQSAVARRLLGEFQLGPVCVDTNGPPTGPASAARSSVTSPLPLPRSTHRILGRKLASWNSSSVLARRAAASTRSRS